MCWIVSYLGIDEEMMFAFTALVIIDTITGVIGAYVSDKRVYSGTMITWLLSKMATLLIPLFIGFVMRGVWYTLYMHNVVALFTWTLVVAEAISILENFMVIRTKKSVEKFDGIGFVISGMQGVFKNILVKMLNKVEVEIEEGIDKKIEEGKK